MEDHVGARDQLGGAHREQPRVARAGADEVRRSRRHRLRAREQVGGAGGEHPLRERGRVRRLVRQPLRAVGQPRPRPHAPARGVHAQRRVAGGAQRAPPRARSASSAARAAASSTSSKRRALRGLQQQAALPGRGRERASGAPATSSRPSRASPAAASTSASTSPGGELAQPRVDVAADLDDVEVGPHAPAPARGAAARSCPTRAPAGSASSDGAPTSTSRGSSRSGTATTSVPSASSIGTSFALCTATSISPASSARSSAPVQRDLSPTSRARSPAVVISTSSAGSPSRAATQRACASASALPRVPSADHGPDLADLGGGLLLRGAPRPRARTAPAVSCRRAWRRSSSSVAQPLRRLVQQALDGGAQHRLDPLAVALGQRLPARGVLLEQLLDQPVGLRAQRGDRRQHLERPEPARERLDLLLDDALGPPRLELARAVRARDLGLQAVDVDERHAGRACAQPGRCRAEPRGRAAAAAARRAPSSRARAPPRRRGSAARRSRRRRCRPARARPACRRRRSCRRRSAGRARSPAPAAGWRRTSSPRPARSAPARSAPRSRRRR